VETAGSSSNRMEKIDRSDTTSSRKPKFLAA
jgi:hypothetical protein